FPEVGAEVICIDRDWEVIAKHEAGDPSSGAVPNNLAYVIYTSGSTGRPKGVGVPHRGVVNRLQWMQKEYSLDETDIVLQKTPFSFDVSVWEFFWPLITGAQLVVAKPGGHKDNSYLSVLIIKHSITTMHFVPPMLEMFLEEPGVRSCSSLRRIICSGEALSHKLVQHYYSLLKTPLHNLYGPTEASIDVSYWACKADANSKSVPIGRPIDNVQLYILDESLNQVPIGIASELHIGGAGLARGYLNRPKLTAEKFIPNPYSTLPGERLYKTGDMVLYRSDGSIEYLGRVDHQVKLRGFRIEPGEIESAIERHSLVSKSLVLLRELRSGDNQLVAYVTVTDKNNSSVTDTMRMYLAKSLPEYMIPAVFITLDSFPISHNGKIDRNKLPDLDTGRPDLREAFVAPRTETERLLANIWEDILGIENVGIHDNFFTLGGHSLLLLQLINRVQSALEIELSLQEYFNSLTISQAATVIDSKIKSQSIVHANKSKKALITEEHERTKLANRIDDLTSDDVQDLLGMLKQEK
ncbi:MAG: amino acid adenylation domain-containing protein, partial [Candidatus Thiodiazotropha sp.]